MLTRGLATLESQNRLEVRVLKDLTVSNAGAIRSAIMSAWLDRGRPRSLIVDLAEARHIDSSGVGALIEIAHRTESSGVHVILSGLNRRAHRMFHRLGLGALFQLNAA